MATPSIELLEHLEAARRTTGRVAYALGLASHQPGAEVSGLLLSELKQQREALRGVIRLLATEADSRQSSEALRRSCRRIPRA